jgi:peptide/nickel transport system permease protein
VALDQDKLAERVRQRMARDYPLAEGAGEWKTVSGQPALVVRVELEGEGARAQTLVLVCCPDRLIGAVLTAPPGDEAAAAIQASLRVVPAVGATVNGKPASGAPRRLVQDDVVVLPGATPVELRYHELPRHAVGTDDVGRDVLSRLIHGTVIAGSVGIVSVSIYITIGVILGALAGYFRGWVDLVISRVIEVVICFPTFFLIITIVALWPPSIYNIMITLGLIGWTGVARLVRGEFLKVMAEDYVQAARALGFSDARIIFRHVLPNGIAPVFVSASFGVAGAILVESSLSFLGFGVAPPTASWGEILQQGRRYIHENLYHLVWAPGFCIFLTVTFFNLVGEGLRDALDPKLRQ